MKTKNLKFYLIGHGPHVAGNKNYKVSLLFICFITVIHVSDCFYLQKLILSTKYYRELLKRNYRESYGQNYIYIINHNIYCIGSEKLFSL